MIANKSITLILPCKNEAKALYYVLKTLPKAIDEVIVVDNGSTDNTSAVAKRKGIKILYEPRTLRGIGYGFALARGMREATGDIIVCADGDGSYPVSSIPSLVKTLEKKQLDFISCSRLPFQNARKMSFIRMFGVAVLNLWIFLLFGKKVNDSLSGMWIFRKTVISELPLYEGGWNFSLEIKIKALLNKKIRFAEVPISYKDREFGSSKQMIFQTGLQHLLFLFKKKFALRKDQAISQASLLTLNS